MNDKTLGEVRQEAIEGLEQVMTMLEEKMAEIEGLLDKLKRKEVPPVWRPEDGAHYWTSAHTYGLTEYRWDGEGDAIDLHYLSLGDVYRTEEEAQNALRAMKLVETIRRERKLANGDWEWPDEYVEGWVIGWVHGCSLRPLQPDCRGCANSFGIWLHWHSLADVIDKYRDDLTWYFSKYLPSIN